MGMEHWINVIFGYPFLRDAPVHVAAALAIAAVLWWPCRNGVASLIVGFAVLPLVFWTRMSLPVVAGYWQAGGIAKHNGPPLDVEMGVLVALLASCLGLAVWAIGTRKSIMRPWAVVSLMIFAYAMHYHLSGAIISNASVIYDDAIMRNLEDGVLN